MELDKKAIAAKMDAGIPDAKVMLDVIRQKYPDACQVMGEWMRSQVWLIELKRAGRLTEEL